MVPTYGLPVRLPETLSSVRVPTIPALEAVNLVNTTVNRYQVLALMPLSGLSTVRVLFQ